MSDILLIIFLLTMFLGLVFLGLFAYICHYEQMEEIDRLKESCDDLTESLDMLHHQNQ